MQNPMNGTPSNLVNGHAIVPCHSSVCFLSIYFSQNNKHHSIFRVGQVCLVIDKSSHSVLSKFRSTSDIQSRARIVERYTFCLVSVFFSPQKIVTCYTQSIENYLRCTVSLLWQVCLRISSGRSCACATTLWHVWMGIVLNPVMWTGFFWNSVFFRGSRRQESKAVRWPDVATRMALWQPRRYFW